MRSERNTSLSRSLQLLLTGLFGFFLFFSLPISDGHRFKGDDKMVYETPYIEIVSFDGCDIITWSSLNVESSGDGDWENFGDLFG